MLWVLRPGVHKPLTMCCMISPHIYFKSYTLSFKDICLRSFSAQKSGAIAEIKTAGKHLPSRASSQGDCAPGSPLGSPLTSLPRTEAGRQLHQCPRMKLCSAAPSDCPSGPAGWWVEGYRKSCWPDGHWARSSRRFWSDYVPPPSSIPRRSAGPCRNQGCSSWSCQME